MSELEQLPSEINISAVFRDSFTSDIDFDIDMTGYVVTAYVDILHGDQEEFTIVVTSLALGQFTMSLTAVQMAAIGVGAHGWYLQWVITATGAVRTAFAGTFKVSKYG